MIGGLGDDESFAAGRDFGDPQRQIVGLAAGAGEDDLTDRRRKGRQKPVGIGVDAVVQIARMDVELGDLPADRLDHARMAMPDRGDVVVDVEIAAPLGVVHPDAFGADHPDRLFVEKHRPSTEMTQTLLDSLAQRRIERRPEPSDRRRSGPEFPFLPPWSHRQLSIRGARAPGPRRMRNLPQPQWRQRTAIEEQCEAIRIVSTLERKTWAPSCTANEELATSLV